MANLEIEGNKMSKEFIQHVLNMSEDRAACSSSTGHYIGQENVNEVLEAARKLQNIKLKRETQFEKNLKNFKQHKATKF